MVFFGDFIIEGWGFIGSGMFFLGKGYVNCGIFG